MYFTKNGGNNSTRKAAYMYGVVGKLERIDVRCYVTVYTTENKASPSSPFIKKNGGNNETRMRLHTLRVVSKRVGECFRQVRRRR